LPSTLRTALRNSTANFSFAMVLAPGLAQLLPHSDGLAILIVATTGGAVVMMLRFRSIGLRQRGKPDLHALFVEFCLRQ
jgi:hypothetical protein